MKRKLGINSDCFCVHMGSGSENEISAVDSLELIRETGFEAVFTSLTDAASVEKWKEKAAKLGLQTEFLHAPFRGINDMWLPGEDHRQILNGMQEAIDSASAFEIPTVIIHTTSGFHPPQISDVGLARFDELVRCAGEKGVKIAFENLRVVDTLCYLAERYAPEPHVGFCYDCGHRSCYTPDTEWIDFFDQRIIATHIHDNLGKRHLGPAVEDDLHLLPFDGVCDYADMIRRLDQRGYLGSLMLEVFSTSRESYSCLSPADFLKEAYSRIRRIAAL